MVGKDGGGERAALNAHGGNDGQSHRYGTASEAAEVVDNGNFLLMVVIHDQACFPTKKYNHTIHRQTPKEKRQFAKKAAVQPGNFGCDGAVKMLH